tara:strand:+ start:11526 stop:12239 length:714 start_codon:yes stop_codon:yes gene_type:complete
MNNSLSGVAIAVVLGFGSFTALGGPMVLDSDERVLDMEIELVWFDEAEKFHEFSEREYIVPEVPFGSWYADGEMTSPAAWLSGTQQSLISDMEVSGSGSMSGSVFHEDGADYHILDVRGFSGILVEFTLTEQTSFLVEADLMSSGSPGESTVQVRGIHGTDFHFRATAREDQTHVMVSEVLTLEAGSYFFNLSAIMQSDGFEHVGEASYTGGLRVIPSPSGIFVLACGGLVGVRRRR